MTSIYICHIFSFKILYFSSNYFLITTGTQYRTPRKCAGIFQVILTQTSLLDPDSESKESSAVDQMTPLFTVSSVVPESYLDPDPFNFDNIKFIAYDR